MTINIGYDTYKFWNCSERIIEELQPKQSIVKIKGQ